MNEWIEKGFRMTYPDIAERMVSCEESGKWDYIIETNDGETYIYDCLDDSIMRVPTDSRGMTETEFKKESGRRLRRMMRRRQITEGELADLTGISQVMISRYVTGRSAPSFFNISKIAKALECSTDELKYF